MYDYKKISILKYLNVFYLIEKIEYDENNERYILTPISCTEIPEKNTISIPKEIYEIQNVIDIMSFQELAPYFDDYILKSLEKEQSAIQYYNFLRKFLIQYKDPFSIREQKMKENEVSETLFDLGHKLMLFLSFDSENRF